MNKIYSIYYFRWLFNSKQLVTYLLIRRYNPSAEFWSAPKLPPNFLCSWLYASSNSRQAPWYLLPSHPNIDLSTFVFSCTAQNNILFGSIPSAISYMSLVHRILLVLITPITPGSRMFCVSWHAVSNFLVSNFVRFYFSSVFLYRFCGICLILPYFVFHTFWCLFVPDLSLCMYSIFSSNI